MRNLILIIFSLNFLLIHSSITGIDNNNNVVYKKEINTCIQAYNPYIEEEAGDTNHNCASPLITNNKYLDTSISDELLIFNSVYYNTTICVECIKIICKERVFDKFFKLFKRRISILRLDFFGILGDNIKVYQNNTNLRRLANTTSLAKQVFGEVMNQSYYDIDNCAYRNNETYSNNVKLIKEVFKEYQTFACANEVYLVQDNDSFNIWKTKLARLLTEEGQQCFKQMQLNDTVIEAIKDICNDDDD